MALFRPEKMYSVKIYGLNSAREKIMQELQILGAVHVSELKDPLPESAFEGEAELIHDAVKNTEKIEKMLALFPDGRSALGQMFEESRTKVCLAGYTDDAFRFWSNKRVSRLYGEFEKILSGETHLLRTIGDSKKTKYLLSHFEKANMGLGTLGEGKYMFTGIGKLKCNIEKMPGDFFIEIHDTTSDGEAYAFFSVPSAKKHELQKYAILFDIKESGTVKDAIMRQEKIILESKSALEEIEKQKKGFEKNKPLLLAIGERWNNIKMRESACKEMQKTRSTFSIGGWVPESALSECTALKSAVVYSSEEKEFAPTKLKNPKLFRPYEIITRNYGLPKYGELDPTIFAAVAFTVFFGFMFMDIAYSLMLIPVALILVRKGKKEIKEIGCLFLAGSISGTLFGLLGGSFLGNYITFNSYLDAYKKPFALMFYAILIGTVHINLGLLAKFLESRRKKDAAGIKDALSWFALESGALLLALSAMLSKNLAAPAALLVAWSLSVRLKDGFAGMLGAIDFFGNFLSYIRLMALALLTSWIAFVINLVAGLISGFSVLAAAVFFVSGHFMNFFLNIISSSLHSLRLNYVEFFGTFYEGGGTEYRPLSMHDDYHKTL